MKYGIAAHLYFAFIVVTLVSVSTFAVILSLGGEHEFDRYETRTSQLELTRTEHWLVGYYLSASGWKELQPFIEEMQVLYGRNFVVTDYAGTIVADTRDSGMDGEFRHEWLQRELRTFGDDSTLGHVYMSPDPTIGTTFRRELERALYLLLIAAAGAAILLALPVSFLLAKPVTRALEQMTEAARRAGSGDFSVRIPENHGGEFGELASALNSMTRDLQEASVLRIHLVADTAHEIRTPISNIRGYVEAAGDSLVEPETALRAIDEETGRLSHLVEELQDLALADAGSLNLERSPHRIDHLVSRACEAAMPRARSRRLTLSADVPPSLPPVLVDDKRILQVLHNLLNNAMTTSPSGSSITVRAREYTENQPRSSTQVHISVRDIGPGIPESELTRVFERFHRVDPSRNRTTGGSGLGLTIARGIVEAHGGTIWAENAHDGGAILTFTVPVSS